MPKRKTRELGLKNVEYAQADILKLQSIDRSFDVIEAGGVLHHLQSRLLDGGCCSRSCVRGGS